MKAVCAGFSGIGRRDNQEDAVWPAVGAVAGRTFVVCDGMGGHECGEVASRAVCDALGRKLGGCREVDKGRFESALKSAYKALDKADLGLDESVRGKMGTTLAFLHLNRRTVLTAHIGDSRVYYLRRNDTGEVEIISCTVDHSLVNELVDAGVITREEALVHPRRNVITRAMQPGVSRRQEADIAVSDDVRPGDMFFLCSDGVTESVDDATLCRILGRDGSVAERMAEIERICADNSRDNHSAWLIEIAPPRRSLFTRIMNGVVGCGHGRTD